MVAPAPASDVSDVSARSILLGSGPRFARDAFGPVLAFYLGWKVLGLTAGIALATAVSLLAWLSEKRRQRPGVMARVSLAIVFVQAAIGLLSGSEVAFFAPAVLINLVYGLAFAGSALIGRPLAGVFASEMTNIPDEVRSSDTYRVVFGRISFVWGAYLIVRALARFALLVAVGVDAFVATNLVTGAPVMALLMTWSVWYGTRSFRRSEEWGWAFA